MPGDVDRNQIDSEGRGRSTNKGDVPEPLRRRYYLDERGGPGLGFYVDARVRTAAFRDLGARLVTPRSDPNAVRDMASVARHRGWTVIVAHGEANFRREVWLTATALGLEVRGYPPSERDRQELERRLAAAARQPERGAEPSPAPRGRGETLRVVETVVRTRLADRPAQERILAAARDRIAAWLEKGAQFEPMTVARTTTERGSSPGRERSRSR